jgi:hypothetical protein
MELPSTPEFVVLLALWTASAIVVFRHADKHGNPRATAWGVFAFLASGIVLPLYFLRFWLRNRQ